jgi:hypothetical protein
MSLFLMFPAVLILALLDATGVVDVDVTRLIGLDLAVIAVGAAVALVFLFAAPRMRRLRAQRRPGGVAA